MDTFRRVRRSVTVWAAVIAAAGSVAGGIISQQGGDAPQAQTVDCRAALQETIDWADEHPADAAIYIEEGDAEDDIPSLYSDAERDQCNGDPERLLEAHARSANQGLARANLAGRDLTGQDLRGANARGASLRGARLNQAHLEGADLRGADLRGASLRDACLRGADLTGARFGGTDVAGANLEDAIGVEGEDGLVGQAGDSPPSACA
jgi:hypothetical protein